MINFLYFFVAFLLKEAFTTVIGGKKPRDKTSKQLVRDDENYVPYRPKDYQSEKG